MQVDHFSVSVAQNLDTDLAVGRPWRAAGSVIYRVQVVAPAAATNFAWNLSDGADQPFRNQAPSGTAVSYEANAFLTVEAQAEREWQMLCRHAGASAQTIEVIVEWD